MDGLTLDPADAVRTLHQRFTEWGHTYALVDAICCVEDLAAGAVCALGPVDGLTWPQWRSMHVALLAIFETLDHKAAGSRQDVVAAIAAIARGAGGMVLPAAQAWLSGEVVARRLEPDVAEVLFAEIDDAICAAFEELPPWPRVA